ncbi:MAG TPA: ComF family protein [Thermoanaerobaculia bacterium]|nr:ComF family protein [Thermoanaerobaculia bacterium]
MLQALTSIGRETARIVLHASCVVCGEELPWRARTASCCAACWESLPAISPSKCRFCAAPWSGDDPGFICGPCLSDPPPVEWMEAWGCYRGPLERVLHAFKFKRHDFFADPLARLVEQMLRLRGDLDFDAVVPVPMHRAKVRRRGYNQAELLARALARRIGVRCEPALLTKTRDHDAQSKLARDARAANVRGAFLASGRVDSRRILLVDDVCTTGATIRAGAGELVRAGAARVAAAVVAKTE